MAIQVKTTKYRHLLSASNNSKKIAQPCKLQKLVLELVLQDDFSTLVPLVEIPLEFDIGRVLQYFESIKILSVDFKVTVIPSPPVTYSSVVNKANLKHLVYVQLGQVPIFFKSYFFCVKFCPRFIHSKAQKVHGVVNQKKVHQKVLFEKTSVCDVLPNFP